MYNTSFLLSAIDSLVESAQNRLNTAELQLLADIRAGIAESSNDQITEEYFIRIVEFLLLIHEFIDKIT